MKPMILLAGLTALSLGALALFPHAGRGAEPKGEPVPVIVELFTSEGCSSCPPADQALEKLVRSQPVPGATIIPLGYHVDYWNNGSWRDTFSKAEYSERQDKYRVRFRNDEVYTPQMIVGGRAEFVGSETGRAEREIAAAAERLRRSPVTISVAPSGTDSYTIKADGKSSNRPLQVWVAVTEDGLVSRVRGGENSGRRLSHAAVVRRLLRAGGTRGTDTLSVATTLRLPVGTGEMASNQHVVAWVQENETGAIVGAAQTRR